MNLTKQEKEIRTQRNRDLRERIKEISPPHNWQEKDELYKLNRELIANNNYLDQYEFFDAERKKKERRVAEALEKDFPIILKELREKILSFDEMSLEVAKGIIERYEQDDYPNIWERDKDYRLAVGLVR